MKKKKQKKSSVPVKVARAVTPEIVEWRKGLKTGDEVILDESIHRECPVATVTGVFDPDELNMLAFSFYIMAKDQVEERCLRTGYVSRSSVWPK